MNAQERALQALCLALDDARLPYMLVGGQANAVWGEPRATLDIDVTVWAEGRPNAVSQLTVRFRALVAEPETFVRETRVLPLESADGVRIDVIFGMLPFEEEAIKRARPIRVAAMEVRVCTPEDLILMKILSDRERDIADARGVALRRMDDLDLEYLEPRIEELATLLERPEIRTRWAQWKKREG
jgi:Nucleotidyltransferase of unknown function (DUF6036)